MYINFSLCRSSSHVELRCESSFYFLFHHNCFINGCLKNIPYYLDTSLFLSSPDHSSNRLVFATGVPVERWQKNRLEHL